MVFPDGVMRFGLTMKKIRHFIGPWINAASKGQFFPEYNNHGIATGFAGSLALISSGSAIIAFIFIAIGWLTGHLDFTTFPPIVKESHQNAGSAVACELNTQEINLRYKFCIQEKCYRTHEKLVAHGNNIYWHNNPEGKPSETYELNNTIELKPPPARIEGTYWKAFGTASYVNGILKIKRERIRYETNTSLFSQTDTAWYEMSVGSSCRSCGMNHRGQIQTKGGPDINYSAFDTECAIGSKPISDKIGDAATPKVVAGNATIEQLRIRAEKNDSDAMNAIGVAYSQGDNVPKDPATARIWFRQAATLGNAGGMNNLAYFYEQGIGGAYDSRAALEWYKKAADLGNATAMWNIANIYEENTQSIPRDPFISARYLLLALRNGEKTARERIFFRTANMESRNA